MLLDILQDTSHRYYGKKQQSILHCSWIPQTETSVVGVQIKKNLVGVLWQFSEKGAAFDTYMNLYSKPCNVFAYL